MNRAIFEALCVRESTPIRKVVEVINHSGRISLAMVVDEDQHLLATLTDGDLRRGILAGFSLDDTAADLLSIKVLEPRPRAVTAPAGTPPDELLRIMQEAKVRQLPLVDDAGRVVDIVLLSDFLTPTDPGLQALIMAGGFGTRLLPLTEDTPKPMLPVGGRPVMEWIVEQLRGAGIRQVNISTHYKPEKIHEHFGTGREFGVDLNYVNEDLPLGTGGALGLLPPPDGPFLVINGDVFTKVNFRAMLEYHQEHDADLTVAVNLHEFEIPYGVVECEGSFIRAIKEKPRSRVLINAGIYMLQPSVYDFIPQGQKFNMTDLIQWLLAAGRTVVSFPIREYWLDIGQHADYTQARKDMEDGTYDAN